MALQKYSEETIQEANRLRSENTSWKEIAGALNVSEGGLRNAILYRNGPSGLHIQDGMPRQLKPWPPGIDYSGENSYPLYDVPPYNYSHQPRYTGSPLRGASSAADAVLGGC